MIDLSPYRKTLIALAGTGAVAGVGLLGGTWAALVPLVLIPIVTYFVPNADANGDGNVDVREAAEAGAARALDELVARGVLPGGTAADPAGGYAPPAV